VDNSLENISRRDFLKMKFLLMVYSRLEPEEQEVLDMWIKRFFRYENGVGSAA